MRIYDQLKQGSEEWLQVRLGKLTASKAQAIATASKGLETLVFECVAEILSGKPVNTYVNPAMENGSLTEAEARTVYELTTGNSVTTVGFVERDQFVGCSPDGLVDEKGLVEIKCPTARVYTEYLYNRKVDAKYYAQMQMQMLVCQREWCDYGVFHPDFQESLIIERIKLDPAFISKLEMGLTKGTNMIKDICQKIRPQEI